MEKNTPKDKKKTTIGIKRTDGFSEEERAAMKERAKELKAFAAINKNRAAGEKALLEKIAEMTETDRAMAERIHEVVTTNFPELMPRTWYGMPGYAKDEKVICFFQSGDKFKTRYSTLGFNDSANLDQGTFWPTAFALTKLTPEVEKQITNLIRQAVR